MNRPDDASPGHLRVATAALRRLADCAPQGPWRWGDPEPFGSEPGVPDPFPAPPHVPPPLRPVGLCPRPPVTDPGLAAPLADLLDELAEQAPGTADRAVRAAAAVADAVLRSASPTAAPPW